jgi:hypothetical protein
MRPKYSYNLGISYTLKISLAGKKAVAQILKLKAKTVFKNTLD